MGEVVDGGAGDDGLLWVGRGVRVRIGAFASVVWRERGRGRL
jgi:hypothetical protein